jgi:GTP-binding protein EngB required for normal cell division
VFSHLRRDKQGKLYWFNRTYEDRKLINKLDAIMAQANDVNRRTSRLEILDLVNRKPQARDLIFQKYDKYKKNGWNSDIDTVVEEWKRDNHHNQEEVKA